MGNCLLFISVFLLNFSVLFAQEKHPKYEMRGVWIATLTNIDWPSKPSTDPQTILASYEDLIKKHRANGINAVFLQIRPSADAFYKSAFEPMSQWLTGKQGQTMANDFDPLPDLIRITKENGMEFHAWLNPFRVSHNLSSNTPKHESHLSQTKPEWIVQYNNTEILNPGLFEVRKYITDVIVDITKRYDIDGIHFDDYFYPYPSKKDSVFRDSATYEMYAKKEQTLAEWRLENITKLITQVSTAIKREKSYVKFGVSPFGVWRNQRDDPSGSATRAGVPSYDANFADTKLWLEKGYIDYIAPQIYWAIGFKAADYQILIDWWDALKHQRHIYVGHSTYKINTSDSAWQNPRQLPAQIALNRSKANIKGSMYYNSTTTVKNILGFCDSLRQNYYKYPAFVPPMKWLDEFPPESNLNLKGKAKSKKPLTLTWQLRQSEDPLQKTAYQVLYRFEEGQKVELLPQNIVAVLKASDYSYEDSQTQRKKKYVYALTNFDRLHNESQPLTTPKAIKAK